MVPIFHSTDKEDRAEKREEEEEESQFDPSKAD